MSRTYSLRQTNPTNTAAAWQEINPILFKGELGFESDTRFFKVGDGEHPWNDLPYSQSSYTELYEGEGIRIQNDYIGAVLLYDVIDA